MSLMTPQQVADYLNVKLRFVYERSAPNAEDPIPHLKLGKFLRYRKEEIDAWINDKAC